jgi:hypothetical protein
LSASSVPSAAPSSVPASPISTPCTANVSSTLGGPAPRVRRMAMSVCFSFTIMTSVATMLKAATATIISRMTNIIDLVISMERKKLA